MHTTDYLIAGSSHAALGPSARSMHDGDGSITVVTRESRTAPARPPLLPTANSRALDADTACSCATTTSSPRTRSITAMTARSRRPRPAAHRARQQHHRLPQAAPRHRRQPDHYRHPGIEQRRPRAAHALDATRLAMRRWPASKNSRANLVGGMPPKTWSKTGASVTIVEMSKQLTSGYLTRSPPGMIEQAFLGNGAKIPHQPPRRRPRAERRRRHPGLDNGDTIPTDLLVAVGVRPSSVISTAAASPPSAASWSTTPCARAQRDVWSAGDCAQALPASSPARR